MAMCQCGLMPNCNGCCKFCLLKNDNPMSLKSIYFEIDKTIENIDFISSQKDNWTTTFSDGISLLGGELFFLKDDTYKKKMLCLVDKVIEKILKVSPNPNCRFSTVTNGFYDPEWLLFSVIDKISDAVGVGKVDVNFSYDFQYRFKNKEHEERVRKTINMFHDRYNYCTGIQMILTQHVIDLYLSNKWSISDWIDEYFPGNQLAFLYPHPIYRGNNYTGGQNLKDFNFTRDSFLKFILKLREKEPFVYEAFVSSTRNSAIFKYTMLHSKGSNADSSQSPVLSDGKEVINSLCNHSLLYQCYSDTDKCLMCDLESLY